MSPIEKLTHCCLIAICCISAFVLIHREFTPPQQTPAPQRVSWVGRKLNLQGIDWAKSSQTVVIGIRSGCHFCAADLPTYQKLANSPQRKNAKIRLLAVTSDTPDVLTKFLSSGGVSVDGIYHIDFRTLGIIGTPTIYVVDNRGIVNKEFLGAGNEDKMLSELGVATPI